MRRKRRREAMTDMVRSRRPISLQWTPLLWLTPWRKAAPLPRRRKRL
jgi:hypothetical protein